VTEHKTDQLRHLFSILLDLLSSTALLAELVAGMKARPESRFVLDVVENSLGKVLHTCVPNWLRDRKEQQNILSVDDVECAINAMRKITTQVHAFAFKDATLMHNLAAVAGCTRAWGAFELLAEFREEDMHILECYIEGRTSRRWRRTMPPTDISSVLVAYQRTKDSEVEFTTMLKSLEVKRSVQQCGNRRIIVLSIARTLPGSKG
jgi:hypothetical protein